MQEVWKDVKGYEGLYQVSNLGRVKTTSTNYIKTLSKSNREYLRVQLHKNGVSKHISVHRLVATAFLDNPNKLKEVNHKDENKTNNNASNLEWCTRTHNNNFGKRNDCVAKKLSNPVRRISMSGEVTVFASMHEAAKITKISLTQISNMCNGKRKSKKYIWEKVV